MVFVYGLTRNLYPYIRANINNIRYYHPDATIYLIAEDDEIDNINDNGVHIININKIDHGLDPNGPNWNNKWTYMMLTKCILPNIIPEDRCILLDVDTIIFGELYELWTVGISDKYLASVPFIFPRHSLYTTAVMVLNLKKMREDGVTAKLINLINTKKYNNTDELVFNKIIPLQDVYKISNRWNSSKWTGYNDDAVIKHHTPTKPWSALCPDYYIFNKYLKGDF